MLPMHTFLFLTVTTAASMILCVLGKRAYVESSFDNGQTWQRYNERLNSAPVTGHLRPVGSSSVFVKVPHCAFASSLRVRVWRVNDDDGEPFGLSWESDGCYRRNDTVSVKMDEQNIVLTYQNLKQLKPRWWEHVHQRTVNADDSKDDGENQEKPRGFFAKYSLYIMLVVGFALGHGIRIGLAELHEEAERDEARIGASQRARPSEQIRVTVPQSRKSARLRKRSAKSVITSSKGSSS